MSILVGAGAGILLCVVGLIVLLRRRRPLPDDLAIAEAADGAADEQRSFTDMVFNETDSQSSDESPTASHDASGASDLDSFFDDKDDAKMNPETRGDEVMNQGLSDLPTERDAAALPSAAPRAITTDPSV